MLRIPIPLTATSNELGYDTLRDLVPLLDGLKPTLRLYARDFTWCSLDPDRDGDQQRFLDVACGGSSSARRTSRGTNSPIVPARSMLRGALVFPEVDSETMLGVPTERNRRPTARTSVSFQICW